MKKQLPIGSDDFKSTIQDGLYYVDKTDFINELFENKAHLELLI